MSRKLCVNEVDNMLAVVARGLEPHIDRANAVGRCPSCDDDGRLIIVYDEEGTGNHQLPFGSYDWKELHYCEVCKRYYYAENSNY